MKNEHNGNSESYPQSNALEYLSKLSEEDLKTLIALVENPEQLRSYPLDEQKRLCDIVFDYDAVVNSGKNRRIKQEELISLYEKYGLAVNIHKGSTTSGETQVCAPFDGVPYCMDDRGAFFREADSRPLFRGIRHRELIIKRHHSRVKAVYEHLKRSNGDDVWALSGGGAQLQILFGNKTGYIAILYLDMKDKDDNTNPEYLKAIGNEVFTLAVEWQHNNHYLDDFSHPEIRVRRSTQVKKK